MQNVPIFCQLCPGNTLVSKPVIWHYNYMQHVRIAHPSYACPEIPVDGQVQTWFPHTVWTDMEITAEEQKAARTPETSRIPFFTECEPASVTDSVDSGLGRKQTKKASIPKGNTLKKPKT
ncbi:hypothetical protein BT96DRAFT_1005284 [Gymnopus androsaceus JB14]|uniref:Uncharacterized protein n=1 Tax=Gymnopus androsaceus JB14 TaxID=1447944 RepID=A0A6A4GPP1_9AGAR|nr:hypothetical protein BT96DRAFT_1005284 [Gymnopus androsaceus JB14]